MTATLESPPAESARRETAATARPDLTVAFLMSCDTFESFFGDVIGITPEQYLASYRNDWSWYYAAGLVDNGVRVILYHATLDGRGLHEAEPGVAVRFLPTARWYRPVAKLRRAFRATRWSLYAQERVNAAAFARPLKAALAADGVDVLYLQEYWGGRFDHFAGKLAVPVVAQDHGGLGDRTVRWFKRRAFARGRAIYAQTQDEIRCVARHGGRATLQTNGCDTSFFRPPAERGATRGRTILTVARLTDKQKRTSDLIRALPLMADDWTLDVVGNGPDRDKLASLAEALGVASRVRFLGFKGRREVRELMQTCGVYAMPSSNEAVCLAVLEAMACGAAVVASRIRTFETLIDDGRSGVLVPAADPPALAAAIGRAWDDRGRLGVNAAVAVAERFDAAKLYRKLADSIRAVAADSRQALSRP